MTTGPTQPEAILRYILTLDLAQCDIAVCIASGRAGDEVPNFRRVIQSSKLAQAFRDAIDSALEEYKKGMANGDIELHEFAADTEKPEHEIEYLDFFPYDSIKNQVRPIETYMDMPHFEHKEALFVKNMRFYVIRVQPPRGGTPIYFYRVYSPSQMLQESPFFAMWLQKDLYDDLAEPTFLFERHVDCISYEEHMFILQKFNFYRIFNFEELEKVAREMLDRLEKKDFIHNYRRFKSDCLQDKNKILKLKNISSRPYLDTLTIDDLHNNIQQYNLPIKVEFIGGKKKMLYDPRDRWSILKLLDDSWVESSMTASSYYAKGKRAVRKK
jgi:Domain of unknown function (DUF4868)